MQYKTKNISCQVTPSAMHTGIQAKPCSDFSQGIGALKIARLVCLQKKNCRRYDNNTT